MTDARRSIGILVEAEADAETVRVLVDRLLQHHADWVTPEIIDTLRVWRGFEPGTEVSLWKHAPQLCKDHGVRVHGKFNGDPGAPDARAARRALALFRKLGPPDVVILVRDADNQAQRLTGLRQARDSPRHGLAPEHIAIGVANPEREAWHLAGFVAQSDRERQGIVEERQRLGFDPTLEPHKLRGDHKRSAKPVLDKLTDGDRDREYRCLAELPLDGLEGRTQGCGLADFVAELRARVVVLWA